jgi:hypothetical protein
MLHIYFDESGCLGFDFAKSGTNNHILITFLILNECRPINTLVKNIYLTLPKKFKRRRGSYLHAHYEKPITIKRFLKGLASKNIRIATMRLDKRKILFPGNTNELYSSMVVALINRLYADDIITKSDKIKFIVSRRNTSKKLNDDFSESITRCTLDVNFDFMIIAPSDDKCLQAVDFVSWALWQKYENHDESYFDLVAGKIVGEYIMYE